VNEQKDVVWTDPQIMEETYFDMYPNAFECELEKELEFWDNDCWEP